MIGQAKLEGCDDRVINLATHLDEYAKEQGTELINNSGLRNGNGKSWHDKGLAMDFCFLNSNVFKHVTYIYLKVLKQEGVFKGITEIEVCQGGGRQHMHLAFGTEGKVEAFTGVYR